MKLPLPLFFLFFFLSANAEINKRFLSGDEYFKKATNKLLFENDLGQAQSLFAKASRKYKQARNYRKMNECIVAIAIIEYTRGDYKKSIKRLNAAKKNHLKWCNDDADGLRTINESIQLASLEKEQ